MRMRDCILTVCELPLRRNRRRLRRRRRHFRMRREPRSTHSSRSTSPPGQSNHSISVGKDCSLINCFQAVTLWTALNFQTIPSNILLDLGDHNRTCSSIFRSLILSIPEFIFHLLSLDVKRARLKIVF